MIERFKKKPKSPPSSLSVGALQRFGTNPS